MFDQRVSIKVDKEIIRILEGVGNKSKYIRDLILRDQLLKEIECRKRRSRRQ